MSISVEWLSVCVCESTCLHACVYDLKDSPETVSSNLEVDTAVAPEEALSFSSTASLYFIRSLPVVAMSRCRAVLRHDRMRISRRRVHLSERVLLSKQSAKGGGLVQRCFVGS